jgi:hypothetical protein
MEGIMIDFSEIQGIAAIFDTNAKVKKAECQIVAGGLRVTLHVDYSHAAAIGKRLVQPCLNGHTGPVDRSAAIIAVLDLTGEVQRARSMLGGEALIIETAAA